MTSRPGRRLNDAERLAWLRLARSAHVGPRTFRELLRLYGSAEAALDALPGLSRRGGDRDFRVFGHDQAKREMAAAARSGIQLTALHEPDYPPLLRETVAPPPLIGIRGLVDALHRPAVALVGARNASIPGLKMAGLLARGLAESGFVTVSGLARGIDTAVHRASLAGGTVAVLAGGHDRIYPPENEPLLEQILATGCAISEMPVGHEPRAKDFPRRNRLIAGLSLGLVVVEAAERSGSLISARLALEENREVFAVPGSPLDPRAAGTNRLLKQGAVLVTGVEDVTGVLAPLVAMGPQRLGAEEQDRPAPVEPADDQRARVLDLLGPVPVAVDDIVRQAGLSVATVRIVLLELELAGRVWRDPAGGAGLL